MKNTILIVCTLLFFLSCKKNENNYNVIPPSIIGKWNVVKEVKWYTGVNMATVKDTTYSIGGEYQKFSSDGKLNYCYWDGTNYQYGTQDYILTGDTLKVMSGSFSSKWHIPTLTSNSLVVHGIAIEINPTTTDERWRFYTK